MASLFKPENREKLLQEVSKMHGRHIMCMAEHRDLLVQAIQETGAFPETHDELEPTITVHRQETTPSDYLEALIGLFKVRDGEMFIWRMPKKPLQLSCRYADQCEIFIDDEDIGGQPGHYKVAIVSARE